MGIRRASWLLVSVIGATIIALVLSLNLFARFQAADELLEAAAPAFESERVEGIRTGIEMFSPSADTGDAVMDLEGGAFDEVGELIQYTAEESGLAPAEVQTTLQENFSSTAQLLAALPLNAASAEIPLLKAQLAGQLGMTVAELNDALEENFPRTAQALEFFPAAVDPFRNIIGLDTLTNFDGRDVRSVPELRTYFKDELIPVMERQQSNFGKLTDDLPPVDSIAPLLVVLGAFLLGLGLFMVGRPARPRRASIAPPALVILTGIGLIGLVLGARMFPALNGGDDLIEDFRPVFAEERITDYPAGVTMAGNFARMASPVTDSTGGATAELPELFAFLGSELGVAPGEVQAGLRRDFPKLSALLASLPFSAVTVERDDLIEFLAQAWDVSPNEAADELADRFPRITLAVTTLADHVAKWHDLDGPDDGFTRFDGSPIDSLENWQEYLDHDLVPMLLSQQQNFADLDDGPPLKIFPPLLLAVGLALIALGALQLRRRVPAPAAPVAASGGTDSPDPGSTPATEAPPTPHAEHSADEDSDDRLTRAEDEHSDTPAGGR